MLAAIRGFWVKKSVVTVFKSAEGQELKERLKALNLRPSQFAKLYGVDRTTILRYINGSRKINPKVWENVRWLEDRCLGAQSPFFVEAFLKGVQSHRRVKDAGNIFPLLRVWDVLEDQK